ncbi:tetratricopeptide repeat protein [Cohnella yongneupensis]|uniref:Tetratricopeptide repeat protein n=1 Tax=Cohnella yongneupensis TaxID=425006 RepID=A0ABW0R458_9BACL
MFRRWSRKMAKKLHRQERLKQALVWYGRWGTASMTEDELIDYAGLLHDTGHSDQALTVLNELLGNRDNPHAYERRAHIYNELGQEELAIADLDAAILIDPSPYLYWYTRAISHHDLGQYDEAVRDFEEALMRREDSKASTFYELGNVYMKLGQFEDAERSYRMASIDPNRTVPHYHYRQSQALEKLGRGEEAIIALHAGIRLLDEWSKLSDQGASIMKSRTNYSHAAVASFIQGAQDEFGFRLYDSKLLEENGHPDRALASIEYALSRYPNAVELLLRKAVLLRTLSRFAETEELLIKLRGDHPLWLPATMELSTTYRMQGKLSEAIHTLQEARERAPDNRVVQYWLADAYREADRAEEARVLSRELTELEPEDPINWKQRAELAIDADLYAEADDAYTKALSLEQSADYYMRRSFARYMLDRYEEAMMDIQSAIALEERLLQESRTSYALGELYVGMENWELADAAYTRALALEPDNPQIYDRRARSRFSAGQLAAALEDCNRGLQLDLNNARLTWLRGFIHFRLDEYDAALADSRVYAQLLPEDPQGHYNLGVVYNQLDRHDEAIASFTKAIEISPFEPQAYLERASLWYHHSFDRGRAAHDLAQWLLYAGGEREESDRFALLNDLRGFDDEMRERAKAYFLDSYGNSRYLS